MYYILNINLMVYVYNLINIIFILSGLKIIRFSYLYSKFVQKIILYTINACNYDVHHKCRHELFYNTETRCKKNLINANISGYEQPKWFHWAQRQWPFYTYLRHIHVLDHGYFTDIVSALAI